jgi:hypothetical protein
LGEDFAAGVGDRFAALRPDLSKEGLELGEDLLDRIEVAGVFRQEHEAGGLRHPGSLCAPPGGHDDGIP